MTPGPAAEIVVVPTSPAVVSVAELMGATEVLTSAWDGLAGALPPAMMVTA